MGNRFAASLVASLASVSFAAVFTVPAPPARAGGNFPVERPFVFTGADVNVVVLPYAHSQGASAGVGEAAQELSLLIQADSLLGILKHDSVGAVRLVDASPRAVPATPEEVLAKLTGQIPGAATTLRPDGAIVLLWGRVYEEADDIFVQSYVRFGRPARQDATSIGIRGRTFQVGPAARSFAFAPRRFARSDLVRIRESFANSARLHAAPRTNAGFQPMPMDPSAGFAYLVTEQEGDWMKVEPIGEGPGGWIRARADIGPDSLRARMPELEFVEGLVGWLRCQTGAEASCVDALPALARFDERAGDEAPLAEAVGLQLQALALLSGPRETPAPPDLRKRKARKAKRIRQPEVPTPSASDSRALDLARKAADLVPYSAEARALALTLELAASPDEDGVVKASEALTALAALEPQNGRLLLNVGTAVSLRRADVEARMARDPGDAVTKSLRDALAATQSQIDMLVATVPRESLIPPL